MNGRFPNREPPVFSIHWFLADIVDRPRKTTCTTWNGILAANHGTNISLHHQGRTSRWLWWFLLLVANRSPGINSIRPVFFPAPYRRAAKQSRLNMGSAGRNLQEDIFSFHVFLRSL